MIDYEAKICFFFGVRFSQYLVFCAIVLWSIFLLLTIVLSVLFRFTPLITLRDIYLNQGKTLVMVNIVLEKIITARPDLSINFK